MRGLIFSDEAKDEELCVRNMSRLLQLENGTRGIRNGILIHCEGSRAISRTQIL